jgi:hypothetical protein
MATSSDRSGMGEPYGFTEEEVIFIRSALLRTLGRRNEVFP